MPTDRPTENKNPLEIIFCPQIFPSTQLFLFFCNWVRQTESIVMDTCENMSKLSAYWSKGIFNHLLNLSERV